MNLNLTSIIDWIKSNKLIAGLVATGLVLVLFHKQIKRQFFSHARVKHRPGWGLTHTRSGKLIEKTKSGKPAVRSVGTHLSGKGYPAVGGGFIPFKYNKDGKMKKAKFVGGTVAAKTYMSHLRKQK